MKKKYLLTLGGLATVVAPIATIVSCGDGTPADKENGGEKGVGTTGTTDTTKTTAPVNTATGDYASKGHAPQTSATNTTSATFETLNNAAELKDYVNNLRYKSLDDTKAQSLWNLVVGTDTKIEVIKFDGILADQLHTSDDYAIVVKGTPDTSERYLQAVIKKNYSAGHVTSETFVQNDFYDVDRAFLNVQATTEGGGQEVRDSLHQRFGLDKETLINGKFVIFLQNDKTEEITATPIKGTIANNSDTGQDEVQFIGISSDPADTKTF